MTGFCAFRAFDTGPVKPVLTSVPVLTLILPLDCFLKMKCSVLNLNVVPSLLRQFSENSLIFSPYFSTNSPSSSQAPYPRRKFVKPALKNDLVDKALAHVPCHYVKTANQMKQLGASLNLVREFAFDVEHTVDPRPKETCLLQISTRSEDVIIDLLCPEVRSKMYLLEKAFENEKIVKVAHGANDVEWLQRDFGIQTANFVNTLSLSGPLVGGDKTQKYRGLSLDRLICFACGVRLHKGKTNIRLVDWTVRPLPAHLLKYARLDTHFLLPAYDFFTKEYANASESDKAHRTCLVRAFVQFHYSLSDDTARKFRELFLPVWRQSRP